jgi:hypothetical protein
MIRQDVHGGILIHKPQLKPRLRKLRLLKLKLHKFLGRGHVISLVNRSSVWQHIALEANQQAFAYLKPTRKSPKTS